MAGIVVLSLLDSRGSLREPYGLISDFSPVSPHAANLVLVLAFFASSSEIPIAYVLREGDYEYEYDYDYE